MQCFIVSYWFSGWLQACFGLGWFYCCISRLWYVQELKRFKDFPSFQAYMEHDSVRRPQLQLAVQAYEELLNERQQYEKEVKLAHGL